ncbi:MAG TPA: PepSY-associated TM helix domain-containing protein [Oleiagrimonas sp.]|nr:PepSY-associated TM helix domain-containing protein [Oleiagrimonas sp.]
MKSSTIRTFTTVHTWTGICAGFFLFIAFYTGALLVFYGAIDTWQHPPWRAGAEAQVSAQQLAERFAATHPQQLSYFGVVLPSPGAAHASYVYWPSADGARFATAGNLQNTLHTLPDNRLSNFLIAIHESLGIPVIGLYFMGIVSVLYGLALVSGFIIRLPKITREVFALRRGRNLKRMWQDAHNVIGLLSLPFHVMFALTGALLCLFAAMLMALNTLAFDGHLTSAFNQALTTAPALQASGKSAPMLPLPTLVQRAHATALDHGVSTFTPDYIEFRNYGDANAVVVVRGMSQSTLGTFGTVAMDGNTGAVLATHVGDTYDVNGMSYAALFGLHFGFFGGATVKWLYLVLGLAGAFLFYSGNLLWIESRRKRRQTEQPARTRWMARATVGVCIGSCLGVSAAFLALALANGHGDADLIQQVAAYGSFALACLWTLWRPIPHAARDLLWATAGVTALAAIVDLIRNAHAWLQPWTPLHSVVLAVDLTGLALAIGFALLARASWRRARHSEANSIWALPAQTRHQSVHGPLRANDPDTENA